MNEEKQKFMIKELRAFARGQLIGKYGVSILAILVVASIYYTAALIEASVVGDSTPGYVTGLVIDVVIQLLFGIFAYGRSVYFLKIARGDKSLSAADLFSGLKGVTDKAILIQAVFTAFAFLGIIPSLLLHFRLIIVPDEYFYYFSYGVLLLQALLSFLACLYFGLSFYLLSDDKEADVRDILKKSMELMKGKKGRLLAIYLSSIPLAILSLCACGIGTLWFGVFFETLIADFYLDTIGEHPYDPTAVKVLPTQNPSDGSSTLDIHL
ncbi:MAG: DUF975 family protein [Lachnospiraceae bacterium]|nr:DUF975 family protein [Lachnospiraceae bacterium]